VPAGVVQSPVLVGRDAYLALAGRSVSPRRFSRDSLLRRRRGSRCDNAEWCTALSGRSGREPMSQTEVVCRRSCVTIRTMAALAVIGATSSYEILGVDAT
jgi:hypothetical protein